MTITRAAGTSSDACAHLFAERHIGTFAGASAPMLAALGYEGIEALAQAAIPADIAQTAALELPAPRSEQRALADLRALASKNITKTQMLGQGFYDTVTPPVLRRNVLENPAWYTAYTPYQPEISQGRLEALLNFQTMIADLTGLPIANASLLDEATAVVEAVLLMRRTNRRRADAPIVVDANVFPHTIAVIRTRTRGLDVEIQVRDLTLGLPEGEICGMVLQQPGDDGAVGDHSATIAAAKERGAMVAIAADILSLTLLAPPGEQGADIAVGTTQRFGVPLFFGGPHAAYMAVRQGLERSLPGRIVGVSVDDAGTPAYRLALQTREQHIRRERATSNICTAQALLAVVASMYAAYHGPQGLTAIAARVHHHACTLAAVLHTWGVTVLHHAFFDTVTARVPGRAAAIVASAEALGVNLRLVDQDTVAIACDETTTTEHLATVAGAFGVPDAARAVDDAAAADPAQGPFALDEAVLRTSAFLTHPVFNSLRSETQMMRYLRRLADRDLALDRTMIPLGSCTMKLNAAAEMEAITWPEFAGIHPFAPEHQTAGWRELIADLQVWLAAITGYAAVSVAPNAGSQGELAGLMAIREYHLARGEAERTVCLIPASAHGTNAASAVLAGLEVVVVATAAAGAIDVADLDAKIAAHHNRLAAIMITYPSTHGVYESDVRTVCERVHAAGGQVYIDGANLNALVGHARPGDFGGDVSHLNLHKTFCIPHGGGGPGVGPVAVAAHLVPHLPSTSADGADRGSPGPVTSAPFGSAGVLPISWAYIAMMGAEGLTQATRSALLAANYVASRLGEYYPVLYTGDRGLVAHECILDLRDLTARSGVTAEDVAKRLMDYGFHAPTLSFPVAGTLMVEPTESEDIAELDRFIEAMIGIRAEIDEVVSGALNVRQSPLRRAPHTAAAVASDEWSRPYSREQAAFPAPALRQDKYFPPVGRIDGAAGDRNLLCTCPGPEAFETLTATTDEQPR